MEEGGEAVHHAGKFRNLKIWCSICSGLNGEYKHPSGLNWARQKGGGKKTVLGILLNSEQNDNYIFYNFLYFVSDTVNKMKFLSRHVYIKTHNDYILLLKHHGFAVPQQTPWNQSVSKKLI